MSYIEGDTLLKEIEKSLEYHDQFDDDNIELLYAKPIDAGQEEDVDGFIMAMGYEEEDDDNDSRSNLGPLLGGAITDTELDNPSA